MKISYDPEADALYIELIPGIKQVRTVRLSESVALDFGKGEILAGIEILDAKDYIGNGKMEPIILKNLISQVA
jgi:uncharacterized protein YuzE